MDFKLMYFELNGSSFLNISKFLKNFHLVSYWKPTFLYVVLRGPTHFYFRKFQKPKTRPWLRSCFQKWESTYRFSSGMVPSVPNGGQASFLRGPWWAPFSAWSSWGFSPWRRWACTPSTAYGKYSLRPAWWERVSDIKKTSTYLWSFFVKLRF